MTNINDLPDEILEFILGYLPPYKDLEECMIVCKRWTQLVRNVQWHTKINLNKAIIEFNLCWKSCDFSEDGPIIAGRFSHSAVFHENSMYVFGGGSSTATTFNDLWCFDLSKRQWRRLLPAGSYPSPKACASMVCYQNQLVLFGGWRQPSSYPPHQPWQLFNELHVYNIKERQWYRYSTFGVPPPTAGHSAVIIDNEMIIFGGYTELDDGTNAISNEVWRYNLKTFLWREQETSPNKPPPRYGQFQIALDDQNILIFGGCGGPNNIFSDAWLLKITQNIWEWKEVVIKNKKWSATHMWCNPACKIGSKLVVLGPTPTMPSDFQIVKQQMPPTNNFRNRINDVQYVIEYRPQNHPERIVNAEDANRRLLLERNRNNQRDVAQNNQNLQNDQDEAFNRLQRNLQLRCRYEGHFVPRRYNEPFEGRWGMAAFNVQDNVNSMYRERQLECIRRMEEKFHALRRGRAGKRVNEVPNPKRLKTNCLAMFVCDLSNVLANEPVLEWIEYKNDGIFVGAPERLILSSVIAGHGELIMFGGLQKESLTNSATTLQVSNELHFLTVPKGVI